MLLYVCKIIMLGLISTPISINHQQWVYAPFEFPCSIAVDESLVQVSLTLFAFTPSKSVRLTCTSQPTDAKLEVQRQLKSTELLISWDHIPTCRGN